MSNDWLVIDDIPLRILMQPIRGKQFSILVEWPDGFRRCCKIVFHRDGSLFIIFPTFDCDGGLLSVARAGAVSEDRIDLRTTGKVTRHIVKYAHHADGEAHFSQDGRVFTKIRRRAVSLDVQRGHLCSLIINGFGQFPMQTKKIGPDDVIVSCGAPTCDKIRVIMSRHQLGSSGTVAANHRNGVPLCAPAAFKMSDRYLLLIIKEDPSFHSDRTPSLTFVGGFDEPQRVLDISREAEFLGAAFPCSDFTALAAQIGVIDRPTP